MSFRLKNFIGDFFGYGRCPVTNDTYWHTDVVSVRYNARGDGILVSARALDKMQKEEIATAVYAEVQSIRYDRFSMFIDPVDGSFKSKRANKYSLDEIAAQIPDKCRRLPWKDNEY